MALNRNLDLINAASFLDTKTVRVRVRLERDLAHFASWFKTRLKTTQFLSADGPNSNFLFPPPTIILSPHTFCWPAVVLSMHTHTCLFQYLHACMYVCVHAICAHVCVCVCVLGSKWMCNLLNLCFSACCHYFCFCVCLWLLKIIYSLYFIDRVLTNFRYYYCQWWSPSHCHSLWTPTEWGLYYVNLFIQV